MIMPKYVVAGFSVDDVKMLYNHWFQDIKEAFRCYRILSKRLDTHHLGLYDFRGEIKTLAFHFVKYEKTK